MVFNRALQERNEKRKEEVKYIDVDPVACAALIWENNFIDHRYQLKYKKNIITNELIIILENLSFCFIP